MADYQVTCTKKDGSDLDRRLDGIGGSFGYLDIDTAITQIESRVNRFYCSAAGSSVWVIVGRHPQSGRKYLTTEGDGFPPNNLLALRDCP